MSTKVYAHLHDIDSIGYYRIALLESRGKRLSNIANDIEKLQLRILKEEHLSTAPDLSKMDSLKVLENRLAYDRVYKKDDSLKDVDMAKLAVIVKEAELESTLDVPLIWKCAFLETIGIILFIYGANMWTKKIQMPQDKILAMQVELLEKQLNEPDKLVKRLHIEYNPRPRKLWKK